MLRILCSSANLAWALHVCFVAVELGLDIFEFLPIATAAIAYLSISIMLFFSCLIDVLGLDDNGYF
jgi:hypothetical protein